MKRKFVYLSILVVIMSYPLFSQENATSGDNIPTSQQDKNVQERVKELKAMPIKGFFGFAFSNSVPQKIYMDNIGTSGPGFGLYGGYRFDPIPIVLGLEWDFHFFESKTWTYSYKLPNGWTYARDTLTTSTFNMPLSIFTRIEPNISHFVFPYIEGFSGFNLMNSHATYKSFNSNEDNRDKTNLNWIYGVGAGIMVKLADFVQLPNNNTRFLIDLNFRYLWSSCSDYYTVQTNPDASVIFTQFSSPTEQVLFNLGIVFHFN
ncbi:MAG TPA: hypothetical protein PLC04_00100 [Candidatus Kapabacteria bacterium]|jgi:hypothetical protein|nr:hypothetical protein [Candidatus Kapabacteria bacterium]